MKALEMSQHFSDYKSMWFFSRRSRAANSIVPGPIFPHFKPIKDLMAVHIYCKNEEDRIKSEGARMVETLYRRSKAANPQVGDGI